MKKRIPILIVLLILLAVVSATAVLAYTYRASYTISENGTASYDMLPVWEASNNQWMIDNGFIIDADALDTRIETLGGLIKPHMITDNMTLTAVPVPLNSQTNLYFTTGNSLLSAFPIIIGWDGYITTLDHDTIELGDNWTVECGNTWVDTTAGSDKNLVYKEGALRIYTSDTGNITSEIFASGVQQSYTVNDDNSDPCWGVNWRAQTFTTVGAYKLTSINLKLLRVLTPGDFTVSIRNTAAGKPSGGDLTVATIDGNSLTLAAGGVWYDIDLTDYDLAATTMYAIVTRAPAGDGANYVGWRADVTAPAYGGGTQVTSGDSGVTWVINALKDYMFETLGETVVDTVTAVNFPSDEFTVTTTANVTHLWIEIDRTLEAITALTANVTNNSENWTWMQSNVMPYADNITISVNGTERLRYKPATYIQGDNLPDLTGTSQNGTITWGTNPTGVIVSLGSMVSSFQPAPGETVSRPAQDILPEVEVSDWFTPPDVSGTLLTNPMRPFVIILSDNSTLTEIQSWRLLALALILLVTVSTGRAVRGHHFITGVACGASLGGMVALTIFPMWALVFMILPLGAGLIAERSPSL